MTDSTDLAAIGLRMMAERHREVTVALTALTMMQEHYGNKCLSFRGMHPDEEAEWYAKAEKLIPPLDAVSLSQP
jgi:hypothetical protein